LLLNPFFFDVALSFAGLSQAGLAVKQGLLEQKYRKIKRS